jgi:hypothetical protein
VSTRVRTAKIVAKIRAERAGTAACSPDASAIDAGRKRPQIRTIAPFWRYAYSLVTGWPADPPPEARRVSAVLPGWRTAQTSLRVLFVIHSLTAAARLGDLISIFQDLRIQLFCTQTRDSMFPGGIGSFIQDCGFYQLTWEQAISIDFHAVICASLGDNLHEIKSPILRIPHGNGYNKRWNQRSAISDQRSAISDQPSVSPRKHLSTMGG